jgi:hypothetical protein
LHRVGILQCSPSSSCIMCFLSCITAVFVSGWYSSISRIMCLINAYRFFFYTAPHILGIPNREMDLNIASACSFRAPDQQLLNLPEILSPCTTETVINTVYRKEGTRVSSHMHGLWRLLVNKAWGQRKLFLFGNLVCKLPVAGAQYTVKKG